jgi:hypothetical protein
LPGKLTAHPHLTVIDREVNGTACRTENKLPGVTVSLVLRFGMGGGLSGQAVLDLEGSERHTIDEQAQVERAPGGIQRIAELPGDGEAIGGEAHGRRRVAW